ncbi:riboflavin synthase [Desulfothermus sp.]
MFTGLVQAIGTVIKTEIMGRDLRISISPNPQFENIEIGESIAVNGACLTVERNNGDIFSVYASEETLKRTNLKNITTGTKVNLERAVRPIDRLGGHLVSGHVDCLSVVKEIKEVGESTKYTLNFPEKFSKYVVEKGSIALDGISLTINQCGSNFIEINIIPETKIKTTISQWKVGTKVNTEFDIVGKYIEKMVSPWEKNSEKKELTIDFLREHGF